MDAKLMVSDRLSSSR